MSAGVCWCLLVHIGVCWHLIKHWECKAINGAVLGGISRCLRFSGLLTGVSSGSVYAGSFLAGVNPPLQHKVERHDFFPPDPFVISKYQDLPIYPFQKCLSYAIFCNF